MKITAIDDLNNLFLVEDLFPVDLLEDFWKLDLNLLKYQPELVEGRCSRRNIIEKNSTISKLYSHARKEILKFYKVSGHALWVDVENFSMSKHLDSTNIEAGMQIYLNNLDQNYGTCFYHPDGSVRYQFPYVANTGYLMINSADQWHAATCTVAKNSFRSSCYFWLEKHN